jgi:hypothetical protein
MAVTQLYTAVANDVITAARWNNEFGNIYNNGSAVAFPLTLAVSLAGYTLTLDAAGVTTIVSTTAVAFIMTPGAKAGTPGPGASEGSAINVVAHTFTDTATAASATAAEHAAVSLQHMTVAASNTNVTLTDAATLYIRGAPQNGTNVTITNPYALLIDGGAVRTDGYLVGTVALGGHIYGLTYDPGTDATNDIDLTVGGAVSDDASALNKRLMTLTSALTKQSDAAWAVGSAEGMLDTGAVGNSDYYVFLIMRPDTGVVDALCSLSSTAPTMPTSYVYKRLIGWFKRTGGTIVNFVTYETEGGGLEFLWMVPTLDVNLAATLTTTQRTDAAKVPLNISTLALLRVSAEDAAATSVLVMQTPALTDTAPSVTIAPLGTIRAVVVDIEIIQDVEVRTSAAGLVAARANVAGYDDYSFVTRGFRWGRR